MAATSARAFVLRHTTLRPVPGQEAIRLHLAGAVLPLWHAEQIETADPDAPLPYWAVAWGGGLAIARYLDEHPDVVAGRRVLDLGSGSGLCAIAAMRAGADEATAVDIDPFAAAAIPLNARANGVRVAVQRRDILDDHPPDVDVVLAGDCWYEEGLAARVTPWLERARSIGIDVVAGDPGRRFLPTGDLVRVATYAVQTTSDLEDMDLRDASVYRLRMRVGSVHLARVRLDGDGDARGPGGAITVALCGHWEHAEPCHWPHQTDVAEQAGPDTLVRTVFVSDRAEVGEIHARITQALRHGVVDGPDGRVTWTLLSDGSTEPTGEETVMADRWIAQR